MTRPDRRLRVTVLMGGSSSERAVSLSTGAMIRDALDPARYEVSAIDTQDLVRLATADAQALPPATRELPPGDADAQGTLGPMAASAAGAPIELAPADGNAEVIHAPASKPQALSGRPDLVFVALHGKRGEDGAVQGMLEMLGLPYTGSGVMASAIAMNKAMTKRLLKADGIAVIPDVQVHRGQSLNQLMEQIEMELGGLPVFVKPNAEGSTVGCALVTTGEQLLPAVEAALRYDPVALIERYVRGVEITVGVLGNAGGRVEPLPTIEIVPRAAFYDYESKYADGGSEHLIPARLPDTLQQEAQEIAVRCHNLLGCRGMSRTDLIVSEGRPYVLEINTIPGMTPTSLLPQAAAHAGIDFQALLDRLIAAALES